MAGHEASSLTVMARLGAAYGVKGWMKLISFTDPPENILAYKHFLVKKGSGTETIVIDKSQEHGKGFIAHVKGCDDREQTRFFTGKDLLVNEEQLPELENDEFYWHQLEGMTVVNLQQENLGKVSRMLETGANDVMVVTATNDSIDDRERLIPWLKETVIQDINLESEKITVDWDKTYLTD
jgi:16S rRNA processing protein RimM